MFLQDFEIQHQPWLLWKELGAVSLCLREHSSEWVIADVLQSWPVGSLAHELSINANEGLLSQSSAHVLEGTAIGDQGHG